jgi:putative hemolysin
MFATAAAAELTSAGALLSALLITALLIFSAAFSGSEAALFAFSPSATDADGRPGDRRTRQIENLLQRPRELLLAILIGNTAVNTLFFASVYVLVEAVARTAGSWVRPVGGAASVLAIIVLAEIVPKIVGVNAPQRLAPYAARFMTVVGVVLLPAARLLEAALLQPAERAWRARRGAAGTASNSTITTAELKAVLELSRRRRVINRMEDRFVRGVLDFGQIRVRDVMVPRVQIVAFDVDGDPEELRQRIRETKLKKIPVYEGTIDNIVGLVYAKMLLLAAPQAPLRSIAMPVRFVPEQSSLEQLLQHFRATRSQIAIVVDEYGGVAGLVTLEDVLEQIVGDIADEHDELEPPEVVPISDTEYEVDGQLSVHYWAELFHLPRACEQVATIGGLVTAELGRPAQVGDRVEIGNVELEVQAVQNFRIERLRVRLGSGRPVEATV